MAQGTGPSPIEGSGSVVGCASRTSRRRSAPFRSHPPGPLDPFPPRC